MSLVLVHGTRKPVIRVGRFAGQYAKPRSADIETRDGVDAARVSRRHHQPRRRSPPRIARPIRELMLRGYERAALTLNFIRALIDGGFADLHHPEYWDLDWVEHSPHADEYQRIVDGDPRVAALHGDASPASQADDAPPRRLLHVPRGARAALRAGADAPGAAPRGLVQPVDALPVDRHAHRAARRRARRVLPRHPQSARRSRSARR